MRFQMAIRLSDAFFGHIPKTYAEKTCGVLLQIFQKINALIREY